MEDRRRAAGLVALAWLACGLAGCSLAVMGGRMLMGDPMQRALFRMQTGVDLPRAKKTVLVVCSAPYGVRAEHPSLDYDLQELVTRKLKRQGIQVVNSNRVARWMDDHGGVVDDPADLAREFETDYVIHVELQNLGYREENSPDLYRGQAWGMVTGYQVVPEEGGPRTLRVFFSEFNSIYPEHYPLSAEQISSPAVFARQFVERVSQQLAELFYDHSISEEIR